MKNSNFKKIVSMLTLTAVIISSFAGCGNNSDSSVNSKNETSNTTSSQSAGTPDENTSNDNTDNQSTFKVGDMVTFGSYEQDNDTSNGAEQIKWQVADIKDGKALLISNYILDYIEYNENTTELPWASSSVYSWLHSDFATTAFTDNEVKLIVDTTDYSTVDQLAGTGEIVGSVFLLSYEEAVQYLGLTSQEVAKYDKNGDLKEEYEIYFSDKALCRPTPYAIEKNIDAVEFTQDSANKITEYGFDCNSSVIGKAYSSYWLRTSLSWDSSWFTAEGHALLIKENGTLRIDSANLSNVKSHKNGIRPCVWINLDSAENIVLETDANDETWFDVKEEETPTECAWELSGTKLFITGEIPEDWKRGNAPWSDKADLIEEVEITGATEIHARLFEGCTSLVKVTLDNTIEKIKSSAFDDCPASLVIYYNGGEYNSENIKDAIEQ